MTFDATLNPVVYEGGIPIFIDTEESSWNMDPVALEKAFETTAFLVTEMLAPFLKLGIMNFGLSIHVIILRDYVFSANRTNRTKCVTD